MADILQFSRNTRVYIEQGSNIWEIPVLDGFSFSQATNATEITLNEMTSSLGVSRRARQMFTDSYAPAEWSFSTYMRPNTGSAVEEVLWANFIANNSYTGGTWAKGVNKAGSSVSFDFDDSNSTILGTFNIYFVLGGCGIDASTTVFGSTGTNTTIYKIEDAVANTASIDFEIDGIAMINWSGFGKIITEESEFDATGAITTGALATDTGNFIRNRLTSLTADGSATNSPLIDFDSAYSLVLTGGNITFENNITYLTPETLCTVNQPLGHVTGTRSISGNFTCYLNAEGKSSAELFEDVISATDVVRNSFDLTFSIGGSSAPKVVVNLPQCHLEVPTHSIEDVIALDTTFHALPSSVDGTDEATITYTGTAAASASISVSTNGFSYTSGSPGDLTVSGSGTNVDNGTTVTVTLISGNGGVIRTFAESMIAGGYSLTVDEIDILALGADTPEDGTILVKAAAVNNSIGGVNASATITKNLTP